MRPSCRIIAAKEGRANKGIEPTRNAAGLMPYVRRPEGEHAKAEPRTERRRNHGLA